MANEIVSELILNLDQFRKSLKEAEQAGVTSGNALGKNVNEGFNSGAEKMLTTAKRLAVALAGAFAVHKIIEAAKEGDAAVQQFNAALFANGTFTENASQRFQTFANELQKVSTVSTDLIVKNGALLVSMNGLSGEGLERATKAALNLSAGLQIDVNTAFQMVGRAAEGNMRAFQQYGIRIQETGTQAGNFATALKVIETRFNGMAEAQTKTFGGAMAQATNNFDDLLKVIGQFITRSPAVIATIKAVSKWLEGLGEPLKKMGGESDPIKPLIRSAIQFGMVLNNFVIRPLEITWNVLRTGVLFLGAAFTGLVSVITKSLAALWANVSKPIIDFIASGIGEVIGFLDKDAGKAFTSFSEQFTASAVQTVEKVGAVTGDMASDFMKATSEASNTAFQTTASDFVGTALSQWDTLIAAMPDKLNGLAKGLKDPADRLTKEAAALMDSLRQSVGQGLTTIMSGTVQRLGATLVKGGSAFADFKNFALNAMGDMSIKMGEAMIVQSAAFQALAALITNPFTAAGASLAFGLALVAIGGILKAAAGGSGASSAAAMGGGGGVAAGEGGLAPSGDLGQVQAQTQRQEPQTRVVVNVQGNILDRRETGLELAAIINESFGSSGITYATT